jgi:hypothetical protein
MVNIEGLIHSKTDHRNGRKQCGYNIYKHNHHITPSQVDTVDLGYLGIEKDFPTEVCTSY